MSGSSLDGLDIALVRLHESGGVWRYEWLATDCVSYPDEWIVRLKEAKGLGVPDFLRLHTAYGHYTGRVVRAFLDRQSESFAIDFIASHGHTIFHDPATGTTSQIGDGASIAAESGLPVISELRNMDLAFGGQGAPIVPLGEQLLFPEYDYWLNLGGIANITYRQESAWIAFDVCACNQVLNALAGSAGYPYDDGGRIAAGGRVDAELLEKLNGVAYFRQPVPKSLDNAFSVKEILPIIEGCGGSLPDRLRTSVEHMAVQIAAAIPAGSQAGQMLATGGGALNNFLIERLRARLEKRGIKVVVPDMLTVQYKEALIMALLGARRWRGETTTLHTVTGASRSSIGGAIWANSPIGSGEEN